MNFLVSQYAKESTVYVNFCLLIINKKWDLCKIKKQLRLILKNLKQIKKEYMQLVIFVIILAN